MEVVNAYYTFVGVRYSRGTWVVCSSYMCAKCMYSFEELFRGCYGQFRERYTFEKGVCGQDFVSKSKIHLDEDEEQTDSCPVTCLQYLIFTIDRATNQEMYKNTSSWARPWKDIRKADTRSISWSFGKVHSEFIKYRWSIFVNFSLGNSKELIQRIYPRSK